MDDIMYIILCLCSGSNMFKYISLKHLLEKPLQILSVLINTDGNYGNNDTADNSDTVLQTAVLRLPTYGATLNGAG